MSKNETEKTVSVRVKSSTEGTFELSDLDLSALTVLDLKEKLIQEHLKDSTSTDQLRLIYAGRVLKDPDTLSQYKIQNGNT